MFSFGRGGGDPGGRKLFLDPATGVKASGQER
jgi:hypothetical protein